MYSHLQEILRIHRRLAASETLRNVLTGLTQLLYKDYRKDTHQSWNSSILVIYIHTEILFSCTVHTMTYFSALLSHEVLFSCRCIKAALGQCANYWLFLIRGHRLTYTSRHSDRFMVPRGGSSEDPGLQWPTTAEWDIVRYWSQCHFISQ